MKRLGNKLVVLLYIMVHHRDKLKNVTVLSQGTYWLYQLHSASFMPDSTPARQQ